METYQQLLNIAHVYWFDRRVYGRKSREEFNAELEKIQKASAELSDALANAPHTVLGSLSYPLQRQFTENPIWPGLAERSSSLSELKKVSLVLEGLTVACKKSLLSKDGPGAREKKHVTRATSALVSFWRTSGYVFKKILETAPGQYDPLEFTSDGPQFVWRILSAIDPVLTIGEVRSALKKVGCDQPKLSRNSPAVDSNF
jgi:hypothetical protein